nr:NUDIX domain-containing protein [Phytoactinopolyspora mesophila]
MLRGVDVQDPSHTWWFTPGGGIDEGESARAAAVRELFEESGLRVGLDDLVGPVAVRSASFPYFGRPCRQDEVFYYVPITGHNDVHTGGWTAVERASVTELRWWRLCDLAGTSETVYPPALPELVRVLVTDGWDGTRLTIS